MKQENIVQERQEASIGDVNISSSPLKIENVNARSIDEAEKLIQSAMQDNDDDDND